MRTKLLIAGLAFGAVLLATLGWAFSLGRAVRARLRALSPA